MDKVIQEFRIIETDDGFCIEIKGDKEELREFVMNLTPHRWMHHGPLRGFRFGPPWMRRGRRHGFGPFGPGAWAWDEEDEEEDVWPRGKRRGRRGHHPDHEDEAT